MKKLIVLSLVLLCSFLALAQINSAVSMAPYYQVNYYSHRNNAFGADAPIDIINPGTTGSPRSTGHGTICADIYVFDANQRMIECCNCPITANGELELSIRNDLTGNPITGAGSAPDRGTIKIVADAPNVCNAAAPFPVSGLVAYATHLKQLTPGGPVSATEDEFEFVSNVSQDEISFLGTSCAFTRQLGSGKGVCTCGSGG
ncbi:MAG TPA: hypothetical protein VFP40_06005 [Terriglobales bacterium]|jgi:hypothetical protein|nr:hypothetical protein [Terriglobales bacterium]